MAPAMRDRLGPEDQVLNNGINAIRNIKPYYSGNYPGLNYPIAWCNMDVSRVQNHRTAKIAKILFTFRM